MNQNPHLKMCWKRVQTTTLETFKPHFHPLMVIDREYISMGWYASQVETCITAKVEKYPKRQINSN